MPVVSAALWDVANRAGGAPSAEIISEEIRVIAAHILSGPVTMHGAARPFVFDVAHSSARSAGCALHGASLFLVWPRKSNQKEGHPYIRVLLRKTPLAPALLRGSSRRAIPGPSLLARHPCLASPYATPALSLLKGIGVRVVCKLSTRAWSSAICLSPFTRTNRRLQTPLSEGRMESLRRGVSGMDAAKAVKGQGWPLRGDPRSSEGMREVARSETRMEGQDFLVPLGGAGHPATAKRDSPSRAKPMLKPPTAMGRYRKARSHLSKETQSPCA